MYQGISVKHVTYQEIKKVVNDISSLSESILNSHSLALIISKSGEATFTRSGWKILTESGCSSPVSKIIINSAKKYTASCGEDCKFFLFILNEMTNSVLKDGGKDESFERSKLARDISLVKYLLPSIFKEIYHSSELHFTFPNLSSFSNDLNRIVQTFMDDRFAVNVSKCLSKLMCEFVSGIKCELMHLSMSLKHVISNFDCFCSKVLLSPISESQVVEGFVLSSKCLNSSVIKLSNSKFIIIWDLSMKNFVNDISLNICDDNIVEFLDQRGSYETIFSYLKNKNIKLILTPSVSHKDIQLMCKNNDIILLDRIDKDEIQHILSLILLSPLENLNEILKATNLEHIGELKYFHTIFINNACYFKMETTNKFRYCRPQHILLAAPLKIMWKEYYSECLNCLKMLQKWLSSSDNHHFVAKDFKNCHSLLHSTDKQHPHYQIYSKQLDIDSKEKYSKLDKISDLMEDRQEFGVSLPPLLWEISLLDSIHNSLQILDTSPRKVLEILHFCTVKLVCRKIGIPFCSMKSLKDNITEYYGKGKKDHENYLEPVICKEHLIFSVLDVMVQLLKIDAVVSTK